MLSVLHKFSRFRTPVALGLALLVGLETRAEDWPQWRGPNRDGAWTDTGTLTAFPAAGLAIQWHAPVGSGHSSPVVAQGRVYVVDSELEQPRAWERIHCFDEQTGKPLWTYRYDVPYPDWAFTPDHLAGPNATPLVRDGRLYAVGATGQLSCLDAARGTVIWNKNLTKEYGLEEFSGITPSPLVDGDLLILVIGGKPDACVVAFNKNSGEEVWKALGDVWTYSSPIVIDAGGSRQLIVWTPEAVTSLDPATGKTYWREKLNTQGDYAVVTPVVHNNLLLISGLMLQLDASKPGATVLWPKTKAVARRILSNTSIPFFQDDYVYAAKSSGHLVCLEANTGKELWETDKVTDLKNGASIQITPNGDTAFLYNDRGELIRARLTPQGYQEISRARVLEPSYPFAGRNVAWAPPAYANRHLFARSQKELVCVSLVAQP